MAGVVVRDARAVASVAPAIGVQRLAFVDGARALAALYVLLNHCWCFAYNAERGYPPNGGGLLVVGFVYGHFAVGAFIAISGFSLALGPARSGKALRLGTFALRRARRILPTYYAALGLSLLLIWRWLGTPSGSFFDLALPVTGSVVLSHLLLVHNWAPVGAFELIDPPMWSIALEWQLYLVFPLLIWLMRRLGAPVALVVAAVAFVACVPLTRAEVHAATFQVEQFWFWLRQIVDYLALFALGVIAAWAAVSSGAWWARLRSAIPWGPLAAGLFTALCALFALGGGAAGFARFDDVAADALIAGAVLCAFVAAASAPRGLITRVLGWQPLAAVGAFSYSLYLVHYPLLALLYVKLAAPLAQGLTMTPLEVFGLLIVGVAPLCIAGAFLFSLVFERPFIRASRQ